MNARGRQRKTKIIPAKRPDRFHMNVSWSHFDLYRISIGSSLDFFGSPFGSILHLLWISIGSWPDRHRISIDLYWISIVFLLDIYWAPVNNHCIVVFAVFPQSKTNQFRYTYPEIKLELIAQQANKSDGPKTFQSKCQSLHFNCRLPMFSKIIAIWSQPKMVPERFSNQCQSTPQQIPKHASGHISKLVCLGFKYVYTYKFL